MKEVKNIPFDYNERLEAVLNTSWNLFKSQFIHKRHYILTEAPFQHHFADILRQVGNLFCLTRDDIFLVDLETKSKSLNGKTKYIDITCEFVNKIKCAIELKFKTAKQGAQDHGRIDMYRDIEALEYVCSEDYDLGKFYAITDSQTYINKSKVGVGTVFCTHNGNKSNENKTFWYNSKGRENIKVLLRNSYLFNWENINEWYFLDLSIK